MKLIRPLLLAVSLLVLPTASKAGPGERSRQPLPAEIVINGVEFVLIPAGEFWYSMRIDPAHLLHLDAPLLRNVKIWLDDYYLAKYEARARDQERFLNAGVLAPEIQARWEASQSTQPATPGGAQEDPGCTVRRNGEGIYYRPRPEQDLPATELSWEVADQFARWMGFRLPTEAEWEKGARGSDKRAWPWGNEFPDDTYVLSSWTRSCDPLPVDALPKGRSPYGLYQMAGNAAEFTSDWYNTHFDHGLKNGERNPVPASTGTPVPYAKPQKIMKGGGWSKESQRQRIAERFLKDPEDAREPAQGVRFALDANTVRAHLSQGSATILQKTK